jgi:hypothetical protein
MNVNEPRDRGGVSKRPPAVAGIAGLYVLVGLIACGGQLWPWITGHGWPADAGWILAIDGLALVLGGFLFLGHNWARWAAVAWLGGHVIGMALFSRSQLAVHVVLFALIAYALFRGESGRFFNAGARAPSAGSG